jgi:hypothetical protein
MILILPHDPCADGSEIKIRSTIKSKSLKEKSAGQLPTLG